MTKYKVSVSIDEKNFFWIVIDNGKLIKKPDKENLIGTKVASYNDTNICPICRSKNSITDESFLYPGNTLRGEKTREWVCKHHRRQAIKSKCKIYVTIDEKNQFWIVSDSDKLIRNPTEEDLKYAEIRSYNEANICRICREENNVTDKSILYPGNTKRGINKEGKHTEEWVCTSHYHRDYQRYDPKSQYNIKKSLRDCRTGNLRESRDIIMEI